MNQNPEWLEEYNKEEARAAELKAPRKQPTRLVQTSSMASPKLRLANSTPDSVDDDNPLIQPREYDLLCIGHSTYVAWGNKPKVRLKFSVEGGKYAGVILFRHYNVKAITKEKRVKLGPRYKLLKHFYRIFPDEPRIKRLDRFPIRKFQGHVIQATVTTVTKDWEDEELPHQLHYSKVDSLLRIIK